MKTVQGSMTPDGYLGAAGDSMYVHAICTLFGLSYLGMSSDARTEKDLAEVCRRAIAVIVEAQKIRKEAVEQGGWRYGPASLESDVSVTSWQLLTLHAARQCGYEVDARVFEDGLRYVNGAFVEGAGDKAGFVYRPGVSQLPEPGITGTALFIKSLLEKEKDERFREGYAYLRESRPGWGGEQYKGYFYFVTFYVAQGVFQEGDEAWAEFAPQVRRLLLDHQLNDGSWEFPPDTKEGPLVGDAYSTAMAVLLLSMDKQYLPMYQRRAGLYK
jgi:hypothetical protein